MVSLLQKDYKIHWRLRWWLAFFSNKISYNSGIYIFFHSTVKHNFYIHWGKKLHDSLYWDICFTAVVWNQTHNISEVYLHILIRKRLKRTRRNSSCHSHRDGPTSQIWKTPNLEGPENNTQEGFHGTGEQLALQWALLLTYLTS